MYAVVINSGTILLYQFPSAQSHHGGGNEILAGWVASWASLLSFTEKQQGLPLGKDGSGSEWGLVGGYGVRKICLPIPAPPSSCWVTLAE